MNRERCHPLLRHLLEDTGLGGRAEVARLAGIEPTTLGFGGPYAIH